MVLATFVSVKMTCSEYDFYFTAMAQTTVVSTSQNAATLKVLKPAVLEDGSRYASEDIRFTIKYFAKEVCCSHGGNEEEYKEFSPPCTFSSSEVEQHITNLKLGTSYSVTLRTEYSTGDCVDSNPTEFKTKPYTGKYQSVAIAIVTYFSPFHSSSTLLPPVWIRTTLVSSLFSSFRLLYLLCTLRSLQH